MEITIDDKKKCVLIWLTNAEQENEILQNGLKPVYAEFFKHGYRTVVFKSGKGDLYESTLSLLLHNRDYFAKREVAAGKQLEA